MSGRKDTRIHLVAELENIKNKTDFVRAIIDEAKRGEFHDYKNEKYARGKIAANALLTLAAKHAWADLEARRILLDQAEAIREGKYDEEADEEDKAYMREFCPLELRGVLGLDNN